MAGYFYDNIFSFPALIFCEKGSERSTSLAACFAYLLQNYVV